MGDSPTPPDAEDDVVTGSGEVIYPRATACQACGKHLSATGDCPRCHGRALTRVFIWTAFWIVLILALILFPSIMQVKS